ncbi:hypothetical protein AB0C10_07320 [Microbispora amethystogenes]|uniref:hypothetical protein n=1 Tax=Microbispora amethystogenes TaxID=1427754 RepID=UPI00340CB425
MSDFTPTPYILDTSVLSTVVRGDADLIGLLQGFDRAGQPLVVPALAAAGALLDGRGSPDAQALLAGLAAFEHALVAPLEGIAQSAKLIDTIAVTGLDVYDAHAAAIADVSVCPILTLRGDKWHQPSRALDNPLHVIEIADPEE